MLALPGGNEERWAYRFRDAVEAPCRFALPPWEVVDARDVDGDGWIDLSSVESCSYCTTSYRLLTGAATL